MTNAAPLTTFLFDLGNVLIPFKWDPAIAGFARKLKRDPEEIRQTLSQPEYHHLFNEFCTGQISPHRFVVRINTLLRTEFELPVLTEIWCSIFKEDKQMMRLLRNLSRQHRTFIISDTDLLHWTSLDSRYELERIVNAAILSFRIGRLKAEKGAFKKLIQEFAWVPEQCVFIDDLEKNTMAAAKAGIRTILHRSYEDTVKQLSEWGIAISE